MTTTLPTPLRVSFDRASDFDTGLLAVSQGEHHSKCYFGNKAKVQAALSEDRNWSRHCAKFMPERGEVRYTYGEYRYAQKLMPSDVEWLDRFDTGRPVRSKTIALNPNGPLTRVLGRAQSTGGVKRSKPSGNTGCNTNGTGTGNSGRAKRIRAIMQAKVDSDKVN